MVDCCRRVSIAEVGPWDFDAQQRLGTKVMYQIA